MFRGGGGGKTSNELPVEGAVRVRKVEKIQAYNLVTKPSAYAGSTATARTAESMAVRVVRVGDVDDKADSFVSVAIAHN